MIAPARPHTRPRGQLLLIMSLTVAMALSGASVAQAAPTPRLSSGHLGQSGHSLRGAVVVVGGATAGPAVRVSIVVRAGRLRWRVEIGRPRLLRRHLRLSVGLILRLPPVRTLGAQKITACLSIRPVARLKSLPARLLSCRVVGTLNARPVIKPKPQPAPVKPAVTPGPSPSAASAPSVAAPSGGAPASPAPYAPSTPPAPLGSNPTHPMTGYASDTAIEVTTAAAHYWVDVPQSYQPGTPIKLLVWMTGCGGSPSDDLTHWVDPNPNRDYMTISIADPSAPNGSQPTGCFDASPACADCGKPLAAVADVEQLFNIDLHRIYLSGFSSGGELAYRTMFDHANEFAGILADDTEPYAADAAPEQQMLAASARLFNTFHLAHTGDIYYPAADVEQQLGDMQKAGYPVQLREVPGPHSDGRPADVPGSSRYDYVTYVVPHIDDGWWAPGCPAGGTC